MFIMSGFFVPAGTALASATVTAATGGSAISADTNTTNGTATWTTLTGPTLTEGAHGDFPSSGTIILSAPTGFNFNTGATVTATITRDAGTKACFTFISTTATPAANTITFTSNGGDTNGGAIATTCHVTFSNIQVRPTSGTPLASGDITHTGTASITGITSSTNLGTLTEIVGTVSKLGFSAQPGSATYGSALSTQPVVKTQDQFGNDSTTGLVATEMVALTLSAGTGSLQGTASLDIGTGAGNGTVTFSGLKVNTQGSGKQLTATASGLTSAVSSSFTINKLAIIVTAATNTKIYDGDTSAAATPALTAGSLASGDTAVYAETYDTKNAGSGKTLTPSVTSIVDGSSADMTGNYIVTLATNSTGTITAKALTVSATGVNKVYDGTNGATVALSDDRVTDDVLTVGYASASFVDKNIGTGKTVSASGITVTGTDAGNYTFNTDAATTADITIKTASVTPDATSKAYGDPEPVLTGTLDGFIAGDGVTATYSRAAGETVAGSPYTISATLDPAGVLGNYDITYNTANFIINKANQAITFGALGAKNYGDPDFDVSATAGASGESVTFTAGGVCTVAGTLVHLTGAGECTVTAHEAGNDNYNAATDVPQSFDVAQKALTIIGVSAESREYNGTDAATLSGTAIPSGVINGDDVTIGGTPSATFANKNVGDGKAVTVSGYTLGGAAADSYTLTQPTGLTANITRKSLTVTATGHNKVYDATTDATVTLTTDALSGDTVTASGTASFEDKNIATAKPVHVVGISLSGTDADNYTLSNVTADTTADITARPLMVSATADNKTYDGNTDAVTHLTTDKVVSDDVTASYTAASFDNKNVGDDKTVHVSGIGIGGADAGNYSLSNTTADVVDTEIVALSLTGSVTVNNKEYDGDTSATIATRSLTGAIEPDDVHYTGGTATFDTKHVGTAKTVTVTGLSLSGDDKDNYTVNDSTTTTADITTRAITVTASTNTKTYDGTTDAAATPTITSGSLASGDTAGFTETYDTQHVGTSKTLTPAGTVSDGNGGANYNVTFADDTTGAIEMLALTLTADPQTKIYGASDPVLTYHITSGALAGGDSFTGSLTRGTGEHVGTYAITQGTLAASSDYAITYVGADLTITKKAITATADAKQKQYGASDPEFTYGITSGGGLASGDAFIGALTRDAGEAVGTYAIKQGDLALSGDYELTYVGADLTIGKATPVITWSNPEGITYPTALSATQLNAIASVPGTLTYDPASGAVLNAGEHELKVDFVPTDTDNYTDVSTTVLLSVAKATPVLTWSPADMPAGSALGGDQLNAHADVPGTFTYDPIFGTVLTAAGTHTLSAHFTPDDATNYNTADTTADMHVIPIEIVALSLTASPSNLSFDQTSEITVTGKDQYGNTVTNNSSTAVVLSADGGGSLADTILTLSAGIATTHLSKDAVGTVHVGATSGVLTPAAATVTFTKTDTSNPFVESHSPENGAGDIALNVVPHLTFSEALNAATVSSANIQLRKVSDDSVIPGTVSLVEGSRQVNITPTSNLSFNTAYYFAVSNAVTDLAGNGAVVLDATTKDSHKFTTVADNTVLAVTRISAVRSFATADNTFEHGWKWTVDATVPVSENLLQMKFADWVSGSNSIPAATNIRFYSSQSSDAADADHAVTISAANTYSGNMTLASDLDAATPGRQIEITVEARVPADTAGGSYSTSYGIQSSPSL